jgi:nucleoside-diphosphate-sugar epimerase
LGQTLEVYGDGNQMREMTYVSDVVEATVAALEHAPGGIYNVGGGTQATVNELVKAVGRVLETRPEVNYGPAAEGDVRSTWANVDLAALELDFRPRVGLEEGIRAQAEWVVEEVVSCTG